LYRLAAEKAGYSVVLSNSLGENEREKAQLDIMMQQKVDAIIQMGGRVDDLITDEDYALKVRGICEKTPVVVTGKLDKTTVHRVVIDESEAMNTVMEHLIQHGHRNIALVGGEMRVASTYYKYLKYQEVLRKHGIKEKGEYVVNGTYDPESGYECTNKVLELDERPTAIIAINDFAASGAVRSIREHSLRIPEDISLVSFDNTYIADLTIPKLTSIDYDYENYGRILIETAISVARGEEVEQVQIITPKLIIRESSGMVNN